MNETDMCHVMIDMETLGEISNSVPMSIGVVQFSLDGQSEAIYHKGINIQSCLDAGLKVTGGTIEWWMGQKDANIKVLLNMLKYECVSLKQALVEISGLIEPNHKDMYVWGHGATFDPVLLENAYRAVGMKAWWKFTNVRDTRTLFDLANYKYVAKGGHDALDDAMNQVKGVQEAYQKLKGGTNALTQA